MSFKIIGTGKYIPDYSVDNNMISQYVETSDEWIKQRVGIASRYISTKYTTNEMGAFAAKDAMEQCGVTADEIDLIIASTCSSEYACPTVAGFVQKEIGADCPVFDINSACSGFLFCLETAAMYMNSGKYKKVLVVGSERISRLLDWGDRSTCVIFGDGAGAAVLEAEDGHYLASKLFTKGDTEIIEIPLDIGNSPFYKGEAKKPAIKMLGQETFKFAVNSIVNDCLEVLDAAGLSVKDVDHFVPHQANSRIINYAAKRLGVPEEKFVSIISEYGNTSSSSVPMALDVLNRSGKLKRGDIVVMSAFGGGLSSAACVIKW